MIRIFFGNPGCGKTTLAVRLFAKQIKLGKRSKYKHFFANFETSLAHEVDLQTLGEWTFPEHSYIICDEAGIEYNNRKFKTLSKETISWFKLHRHFKCDLDFISQSWEDIDITVRRLADELWYIKRIGPFTMCRRVYKKVGIDDVSHQIIDKYEFGKLLPCILPFPFHRKNIVIFFRRPYYKYFDSYSKIPLPLGKVKKTADKDIISKLNRTSRKKSRH